MIVINSFPSERLLVLRERAAGTYYASAYFMAKNCAELMFQVGGWLVELWSPDVSGMQECPGGRSTCCATFACSPFAFLLLCPTPP
jgi:hypothetical protein